MLTCLGTIRYEVNYRVKQGFGEMSAANGEKEKSGDTHHGIDAGLSAENFRADRRPDRGFAWTSQEPVGC